MKSSKYWTESEIAVAQKAAMGLIERTDAYRLLQSRTKRSVDKQIGMMRGTRQCLMPTALPANDPGYDDTQEWRACVDAGEGSAALLAALARWHPERVMV